MKKARWWIAGIIASPFALILIFTILLYLPPVQKWAVDVATRYASEETGMQISIEKVRLRFPLNLELGNVKALKQNVLIPQKSDTVLLAETVLCDVQLMPLLDSRVEVDALQLDNVKLHTIDFIPQAIVKGKIGRMHVQSHGIDLQSEDVILNKSVLADAYIDVALVDTVVEDTSKTQTRWKINVQELKVERTGVKIHMPGDTLNLGMYIGQLQAKEGLFDLYKSEYKVRSLDLCGSRVNYDNRFKDRLCGFDANHIAISDLNMGIDSLYNCNPLTRLKLRALNMKEKSGVALTSMTGKLMLDSATIHLEHLNLKTPYSTILANVDMDLNTFDETNPGQMEADVDACIDRKDIEMLAGRLPEAVNTYWKTGVPLTANARMNGNMKRCVVNGEVGLRKLASVKGKVRIADINLIDADLTLNAAGGTAVAKAKMNIQRKTYNATMNVNHMNVGTFLPGQDMGAFSGTMKVNGNGYDVFSKSTNITATANVRGFRYRKHNLTDIIVSCNIRNGRGIVNIDSDNPLLKGNVNLDALMDTRNIRATLATDVNKVDLFTLGITKEPLTLSVCGHVDFATNMNDYYKVQGLVSDLIIRDSVHTFRPDDMVLDVLTRRDTTRAVVDCGDFHLNGSASGGYKSLMKVSDRIKNELNHQWTSRIIDEKALRNVLPVSRIHLTSGTQNPIYRLSKYFGYDYAAVNIDMNSSPQKGLEGEMRVDTLKTNDLQLDRITLSCNSDENKLHYHLSVENGQDNPQYSFLASIEGSIEGNGTVLDVAIDDKDRARGLQFGISAQMEQNGIRIVMNEQDPILGYKSFKVNDDNYVFFANDMRLSANVKLKAEDGMGVQIYTDDDNLEALQDVTLSLNKFDIEKILAVVPYMPKVQGIMDGDFHLIQSQESLSVASSVGVRNLVYEGWSMGNLESEFVYVPYENGAHHIDGVLYKEGNDVATLVGTYNPEGDGNIDATLTMNKTPLDLVNGFIPDQIIGLKGTGEGELTITGTISKPVVEGEMFLEEASLISVPYGINMRFDDDPVRIKGSKLLLENFQMYSNNNNPLIAKGYIDFADLNHIFVDLRMRAENFLLVDAKETKRSEAYGKAFINLYAMINGELAKLNVRGKLDVLPTTNLYYILRDSPITTDNRLNELVTFTDLNAEQQISIVKPTIDGIDVDLTVSVSSGSHITCWINADHSNYLDIIGGGDLRLKYRNEETNLTGKYTIGEGEMKYSLPVIPLKTFKIQNGSFIEFTGDMMNPRLNISATESTKATVSVDGVTRMVAFQCGVVITKTLNDMGLEFVIDAPEEQSVHDQLQLMSAEERGKLAVTMLTTGMYFADGNTSAFSMNSALNSFLQAEINNIAGSALRTLDLSVGMENSTDETGSIHTDYAFKFAKRFWNNRLSVAIGGKFSTGPDLSGKNKSFFDNVEVQYRMGDDSNQYLRLYYNRDAYDFLEGYVTQYGGGYMWKRKLQFFKDIFRTKETPITVPAVTEKRDTLVRFGTLK